jgi:hypothetical protein
VAAKLEVFGLINNAHTTSPDLAEDAVVGYILADHISDGRCPAVVAVMLGCSLTSVNCDVLAVSAPLVLGARSVFGSVAPEFPK